MEKLDEIKLYIKQSQDELEGGIWDGDPLCLFTMLVDLQAENEELKEQVKQLKQDVKTAYGAFLK